MESNDQAWTYCIGFICLACVLATFTLSYYFSKGDDE